MEICYTPAALLFSVLFCFSTSSTEKSHFLKFSSNNEPEVAYSFATLKSGQKGVTLINKFTICGSMYIGHFTGKQKFYSLQKKESLWFQLRFYHQNLIDQTYSTSMYLDDKFINLKTKYDQKLSLNPFSWSHACTSVDGDLGTVTVVINGMLMKSVNGQTQSNVTFVSKNIIDSVDLVLEHNLILGASEASVTNVNVHQDLIDLSQMTQISLTGECKRGDYLSWSDAEWIFNGSVESVTTDYLCKTISFPNLFPMSQEFPNQADCISLCPRIQAGGRLPSTASLTESQHLVQQILTMTDPKGGQTFWAPFVYISDNHYADIYTGQDMPPALWVRGQPNGGKTQPCTDWSVGNEGKLYDDECFRPSKKRQCICQFIKTPILTLRGLCKDSNIDTHYTMKYVNDGITYMGLYDTNINFFQNQSQKSQWMLTGNMKNAEAFTFSKESSYVLGKHSWTILNDSIECEQEGLNTQQLKMSGCIEGEFTCNNGDCVDMTERCDQVLDCADKSDEVNCKVVFLEESYRKDAPPVSLHREKNTRKVIPASVWVDLTLLDISGIRETNNVIDIKFTAELKWIELRATYHNLKKDSSQNTIGVSTGTQDLWIPNLIYRNNKDNDDTRSEVKKSKFLIERRGNFTRSGLEVLDEIEIFTGKDNPIIMLQSYTKEFRCTFNLRVFPFDTQVSIFMKFCLSNFLSS